MSCVLSAKMFENPDVSGLLSLHQWKMPNHVLILKEGGWASKGRDLKVESQEEIQRYYDDSTFSQSLNVFLDTTYQVIL